MGFFDTGIVGLLNPLDDIYNGAKSVTDSLSKQVGSITPASGPGSGALGSGLNIGPSSGGTTSGSGTLSAGALPGGGGGGFGTTSTATTQPTQDATVPGVPAPTGPSADTVRNEAFSTIDKLNSTFKQLFGLVDKAIGDQRSIVEQGFNQNETALTNQAATEADQLSRAFVGRGLGSSSFRTEGLGQLAQGVTDQLGQLNQQEQAQLAGLGQEAGVKKAGFEGTKQSVARIAEQLPQVTDVSQLQSLADQLNQLLAQNNVESAGLGTQGEFINQLQGVAPGAGDADKLTANLTVLAQSIAPTPFKQKVAQGIIASSGLSQKEKDDLYNQFLQNVG